PYTEDLARKPELTFVLSGDPQFDDLTLEKYKGRFSAVETMNKALVEEINRLKPAIAFVAGDLTNKHTPTEWQLFREIYGKLTIPAYFVPGNHDRLAAKELLGSGKLKDLEETEKKNWEFVESTIKTYSGPLTLYQYFTKEFPSAGKPYYTVEKAGCVFICLDSSAMDQESGGLGREQLTWLEKELERTKNARHVFVISHYPVFQSFGNTGLPAYQEERDKVLSLLKKYRVAGFLCGHRHFSASFLVDSTFHLIADDLCWGEYTSYWIVHVFPDQIIYALKPFQAPRHGLKPLYERIVVREPRAER
ncbi:MAG: metallophosphoesterase, partial [Candidatus Omnitrophica bacterium]|nr:metallophosphoesterase [Candidatus Omnitrophota bacterium]